jgi:hypothetical protein
VAKLRSMLQSVSHHFCNSSKRQGHLKECQLSEGDLSRKVLKEVVTR